MFDNLTIIYSLHTDQEDCVGMYPEINATWNDDNCGRRLGYICKIPHDGYINNPVSVDAMQSIDEPGHCQTGWTRAGLMNIFQCVHVR